MNWQYMHVRRVRDANKLVRVFVQLYGYKPKIVSYIVSTRHEMFLGVETDHIPGLWAIVNLLRAGHLGKEITREMVDAGIVATGPLPEMLTWE